MCRDNYPPELRERAIRMVAEICAEYTSDWVVTANDLESTGIVLSPELRGSQPGVAQRETSNSWNYQDLRIG